MWYLTVFSLWKEIAFPPLFTTSSFRNNGLERQQGKLKIISGKLMTTVKAWSGLPMEVLLLPERDWQTWRCIEVELIPQDPSTLHCEWIRNRNEKCLAPFQPQRFLVKAGIMTPTCFYSPGLLVYYSSVCVAWKSRFSNCTWQRLLWCLQFFLFRFFPRPTKNLYNKNEIITVILTGLSCHIHKNTRTNLSPHRNVKG